MLADAHACAEGASPTRMLGAARAQPSYTLRALLLCIDPTCAFPLLLRPPLHRSIEKIFAHEHSEATEHIYSTQVPRPWPSTRFGVAAVAAQDISAGRASAIGGGSEQPPIRLQRRAREYIVYKTVGSIDHKLLLQCDRQSNRGDIFVL